MSCDSPVKSNWMSSHRMGNEEGGDIPGQPVLQHGKTFFILNFFIVRINWFAFILMHLRGQCHENSSRMPFP
jgi:hypothetical protein